MGTRARWDAKVIAGLELADMGSAISTGAVVMGALKLAHVVMASSASKNPRRG
jgi:hypothetical protein